MQSLWLREVAVAFGSLRVCLGRSSLVQLVKLQGPIAIQTLAAAETEPVTVRLHQASIVELVCRESACKLELRVRDSSHSCCAGPILLSFLSEALRWRACGFREALRGRFLDRAAWSFIPQLALSRVGQRANALRLKGFEAGDVGLWLNFQIDNRLRFRFFLFIFLRCRGCFEFFDRFEFDG